MSKKDDKDNKKKSQAPKKPGRKIAPIQKIKNLDEATIKKVIEDKKEEMSVAALDIAREMASRMDLEIQQPLTDLQQEAAYLYASGLSIEKTAEKMGINNTQIIQWMKIPAFMKGVHEQIFSPELMDKSERTRLAKRRNKELNDSFFKKLENNELDGLPITTTHKMIIDSNKEIADLVDAKDEKIDNNNVQIMIVNHFKSQGKDYSSFESFLNDPEFDFRDKSIIDVESEDV